MMFLYNLSLNFQEKDKNNKRFSTDRRNVLYRLVYTIIVILIYISLYMKLLVYNIYSFYLTVFVWRRSVKVCCKVKD